MDRFYKLVCTVCSEEFNAEEFYDDEVCTCCGSKLKRVYCESIIGSELDELFEETQYEIEEMFNRGVFKML